MDTIVVVLGPVADSATDVLVAANLGNAGLRLEQGGFVTSSGAIILATVDTTLSDGAGQYAERYDRQLTVTYGALASAAVGAIAGKLMAAHVLAGLGVVVTGPALAVAVVSGTVVVSGLTFAAGVISVAVFNKYVSAGLKNWSKGHYTRNVGYFR